MLQPPEFYSTDYASGSNTDVLSPYVKFIQQKHPKHIRYYGNYEKFFSVLIEIPPHTRTITYYKKLKDLNLTESNILYSQIFRNITDKNLSETEKRHQVNVQINNWKEPLSFKLAFPFTHIILGVYYSFFEKFQVISPYIFFSQKTLTSLNPDPSNCSVMAPLPNVHDNARLCFDKGYYPLSHEPHNSSVNTTINQFINHFFNSAFNPDINNLKLLQRRYPSLYPLTLWETKSQNPNFIIDEIPKLIPIVPYRNLQYYIKEQLLSMEI